MGRTGIHPKWWLLPSTWRAMLVHAAASFFTFSPVQLSWLPWEGPKIVRRLPVAHMHLRYNSNAIFWKQHASLLERKRLCNLLCSMLPVSFLIPPPPAPLPLTHINTQSLDMQTINC